MSKTRIENFSDGVFSILITLMVFQFKLPKSGSFSSIFSHSFLIMLMTYATSFLIIAGFWIGHHMELARIEEVDTYFLWVNIAAIFPITLIPLTTEIYGTFEHSQAAALFYTGDYSLSNLALLLLNIVIITQFEKHPEHQSFGSVLKKLASNRLAGGFYTSIIALVIAYFWPQASIYVIFLLTITWIARSIRIERHVLAVRKKMDDAQANPQK